MNRSVLMVLASFVALTGCQTLKDAPNMATLGVDFSWKNTSACSSKSPAFKISGVPDGTKTLKFWMTDLNVPSYTHGGGNVEHMGSGDIPAGAFSYTGPCPPSGSHKYQWEVTAINAAGDTIVGKGQATKPFPPN